MSILNSLMAWVSPQLLIRLAFSLWSTREFLVFHDQRLSRRQILAQIQAWATGLSALGVNKGDRLAVLLPACPEAVCALFLPNYLGTIHVPLNPLLGEEELHTILYHSQAKVVLTCHNWYGMQQATMLRRLQPELPDLEQIIVVDAPVSLKDGLLRGQSVMANGRTYRQIRLEPADPVLLTYTSGTTGQPKGVLHDQGHYWGLTRHGVGRRMSRHALQCLLLPFPPYHYAGIFGIMTAFVAGGKVILMDHVDPNQMLAFIQEEKVTQIGGSTTLYRLLLSAAAQSDGDTFSLRRLTCSAEKLPPELAQALSERFRCNLDNFYGTTETMLVTWTGMDDPWQVAANTVGKPVPGAEVRIVGPGRESLPAGAVGEIAVRTSQMMNGYYRNPELTTQVLDAAGWFYTGDLGYLGMDGNLRITGRSKDAINRAGEMINPEEIEVFLESHPCIRRAAVIGVPNAMVGEELLAFIEPKPGTEPDLVEIRRFCRGRIAPHKVPNEVRILASLPVTSTGKIQKYKLRDFNQ